MTSESKEFKLNGSQPAPEINDAGEFFADLVDHLRAELFEHGIARDKVGTIVLDVVCKLSETFSGESFYVSKKPQIFARQMAIYSDLQYMKHVDVDKKYQVSQGYSLKVANQIREKRHHREQLRLGI